MEWNVHDLLLPHSCMRELAISPGQELRRTRSIHRWGMYELSVSLHARMIPAINSSSSAMHHHAYVAATCVILSNHVDVYIGDKPLWWFARRNHGAGIMAFAAYGHPAGQEAS